MTCGCRPFDRLVTLALGAALAAFGAGAAGCGSDAAPAFLDGGFDAAVGCGNGTLEEGEECDDGNLLSGDGCENDCTFTCVIGAYGDARCDDQNPCNGVETCGPEHACVAGTPLDDGADCGDGKVCVGGLCLLPSCGDGQVQTGEECDDGNATPGDGCENDCRYTCVSSDATRDCAAPDACHENGTCDDDTTHRCTPGASLTDGTACGSGQICLQGVCGASVCGDGYVDAALGEECEDGNNTAGDGCEPGTCQFSCGDPATDCTAAPVCRVNTCSTAHVCVAVPDATQNGQVCGNGLICTDGECVAPPQVCGNGAQEGTEECDDHNRIPADGCELDCTYTCHDPATDCPVPAACTAAVCVDVVVDTVKVGQKCGTVPADEGQSPTGCDAPNTCHNGACVPPGSECGNGVTEPGEQCDFGPGLNLAGSGCEPTCQLSCTKAPDSCPDTNVCNGTETCTDVTVNGHPGQKCAAGAPADDGTSCGGADICLGGSCVLSTCGDGFTDATQNEECDFGPGLNTAGSGCEPSCHFSCTTAPDSCPDANVCNGTETCGVVTVNDRPGQKCAAGTPLAEGTSCGAGTLICVGDPIVCAASSCGDGYVDPLINEECEPPSTATCDASCKWRPVCGDDVLQSGEQCDDNDGTPATLDGCDASCRYEAMVRMTDLQISGAQAPSGCAPRDNVFGRTVLTGTALSALNPSLRSEVTDGNVNILVQMIGLDDLTGTADPSLQLGLMSGDPDPARGAWPGGAPLDWWFLVDPTTVDAGGLPVARFTTASLAARNLAAGPSDVTISLALGGSPAALQMRAARLFAGVDNPPAPSHPPYPPLLASGLTMFETMTATAGTQGLCGNITVASLAQIPLPEDLAAGGSYPCEDCTFLGRVSHSYTYCGADQPVGPGCNSLLDAMVGGCRYLGCFVGIINATQPDVDNGGTATLTLGTGNKVPASQTDGNLNAYSSYVTFTANRAHATGRQ
jgi:cysteine-rich repeat protein